MSRGWRRFLARDGQRQLSDRARLVDHQPRHAVSGRSVQQPFQGGLVVDERASEYPFAVIVEDLGEMLVLADIQRSSIASSAKGEQAG